jgi:photosynthetic reaction center cytochrome c subunit
MRKEMSLRVFVVIVLGLMVIAGVLNTPTQVEATGASAEAAPQQAAAGDKPTEQVQKNIKVLTGLPQSQLIPVMNYMSSSLGVRCTFCHVNTDGKWDFAADTKPEKGTAREMIKMVMTLNKVNFGGANEVSCYTCHRGRSHPQSVPALPVPEPPARPAGGQGAAAPAAAPGATPGASPSPTPANPAPDVIVKNYETAIGGPTLIQKLDTAALKGTFVTSNGMTIPYEVYISGPDKIYTLLDTARQGKFERGFDGTMGWEQSSRGVRDIAGDELFLLRRYGNVIADARLKDQFSALTYAGKDKIDDREVIVLRGTMANGKRERLYFDAQTNLLVRRIIFTTTVVGVIPEQVDYEDYRDVDGMKLPFKIRVSSVDPNQTATRQFTEIKLNAPVDATKFKKPAPKPAASPAP